MPSLRAMSSTSVNLNTNYSEAGVTALQQESAQLSQQIQGLQTQINTMSSSIASEGASSSAGERDSTLLNSLRNEQNEAGLKLNSVNSQIVTAELSNGSANSDIHILQKAAVLPELKYRSAIEAGIIGFGVGIVGSIAFVLLRRQRDRRLRLRDEIARAAGAPVIASLEAPSCTTASAWRRLLKSQPRATAEWALRRVLDTPFDSGDRQRSHIRVISLPGDFPALTTGPRLALHAAASGTPTALLPEDHRSLVPLREAFSGSMPVGGGLPFTIGLNDIGSDWPRLLVSIAVFEGNLATLTPHETINLLSISPGTATEDELVRLALEATDCGFPLDSVVVVNPDPGDTTTGLIADEAFRLMPSRARTDGESNGVVPFESPISRVDDSSGRISSRER